MVNTERHGVIKLEYKPCLNQCEYSENIIRKTRPWLWNHSGTYLEKHAHNTSQTNCNKTSKSKNSLYNGHLTSGETRTYTSVSDLNVTLPGSYLDQRQILDSLPYLELPSTSESSEYIQSITNHSFSPRCGGIVPVTSRLKIVLFCVLVSMLLLCKGCVCVCPENLVSEARSEYLTFVNETNMAAVSGQCLTMTGSVIDSICDARTEIRMSLLRHTDYYTPFCELPLLSLLSEEEKKTVQNCSRDEGCARVLNHVRELDEELSDMFCQFEDVLERIDCKDMFPTEGNCHLCKTAYKQWLCSVYNVRYIGDVRIKPCIEFCDHVSETCPFFRPHGETLIGEPGFLCKDSISPADAAVSVYGPDGCCFKPCHLYPTGNCPDLDISSNCTYETNSASPSSYGKHYHIYMIVVFFILCSYLRHTFPCNRDIGLT